MLKGHEELIYKTLTNRDGEMPQWLSSLAALLEELG